MTSLLTWPRESPRSLQIQQDSLSSDNIESIKVLISQLFEYQAKINIFKSYISHWVKGKHSSRSFWRNASETASPQRLICSYSCLEGGNTRKVPGLGNIPNQEFICTKCTRRERREECDIHGCWHAALPLGTGSERLLRLHLFVEAMLLSDSSTLHIKMSSNHLALKPVKWGSKRFLKEVSSFEFVQRLSGIIL